MDDGALSLVTKRYDQPHQTPMSSPSFLRLTTFIEGDEDPWCSVFSPRVDTSHAVLENFSLVSMDASRHRVRTTGVDRKVLHLAIGTPISVLHGSYRYAQCHMQCDADHFLVRYPDDVVERVHKDRICYRMCRGETESIDDLETFLERGTRIVTIEGTRYVVPVDSPEGIEEEVEVEEVDDVDDLAVEEGMDEFLLETFKGWNRHVLDQLQTYAEGLAKHRFSTDEDSDFVRRTDEGRFVVRVCGFEYGAFDTRNDAVDMFLRILRTYANQIKPTFPPNEDFLSWPPRLVKMAKSIPEEFHEAKRLLLQYGNRYRNTRYPTGVAWVKVDRRNDKPFKVQIHYKIYGSYSNLDDAVRRIIQVMRHVASTHSLV